MLLLPLRWSESFFLRTTFHCENGSFDHGAYLSWCGRPAFFPFELDFDVDTKSSLGMRSCGLLYSTSIELSANPLCFKISATLSRWSPCRIMRPSFTVPPVARFFFIIVPNSCRSFSFILRPSRIVVGFPNRLISIRTFTRACSRSSSAIMSSKPSPWSLLLTAR